MEPMDFDSFVKMINEMTEAQQVESPLSQLSSEELALIKSFDPDLVDEISVGKITPSEAVLLARSATSNQEQEHAIKENDKECADSVLQDVFEAAENRLENNRQEAKKLKEEADEDLEEDPDEGEISDEEWQNALDSKYEEIFNNDKLEINIADKVHVEPSKSLDRGDSDKIYYVMDNDVPCAFWDDEDWVEQGLLIKTNGYGDFVKDDNTVWAYCAVLDDVMMPEFNPEDPLNDVNDHLDEDEIIVEEELMFIPELRGKVGKIWQGEPTNDFNEAYEQALAESYLHEDSEVIVRDSLNRILNEKGESTLVKDVVTDGMKNFKKSGLAKGTEKILKKTNDVTNKGIKKVTDWGKRHPVLTSLGVSAAGSAASALKNTADSLADQGSSITDTVGQADAASVNRPIRMKL